MVLNSYNNKKTTLYIQWYLWFKMNNYVKTIDALCKNVIYLMADKKDTIILVY